MSMPPIRHHRLLSVADVAERLNLTTKTIRRWVKRDDLHFYRLGRQLRISEEDLTTFLNRYRR